MTFGPNFQIHLFACLQITASRRRLNDLNELSGELEVGLGGDDGSESVGACSNRNWSGTRVIEALDGRCTVCQVVRDRKRALLAFNHSVSQAVSWAQVQTSEGNI